ncbi:MAG: carboxypeptidase regulatory-like domain-containing protein [Acidobacteriaceae bacterium]|nr:carboxypeptidase regulatory-like domain-containing protein [Acidobacteriaceae bacterium]
MPPGLTMKITGASLRITLLALWSLSSAYGQAISGDLVGTITDATGGTVANATVTATNTATNIKNSTATNSSGEYRLSNLEPGNYNLTATATGFAASELRDVAVQLNQTTTANLSLKVGTVSTAIEVTEAAAMIDTTTAQIQNTFITKQVADFPNTAIGQGVLNLSLLNAGVASSGGIGVGTGPSIGGQRPRNNNFTVDGVDNNNKSVTGPIVYVPNESVAEFTLLQNQYQAEYGHSSGGQFNTIVKSGSNNFHGTLYDYLRNRNLNALDQSFKNKKIYTQPRYDQNHLGANFGGPMKKDKLFFFTSFEYNPLEQASTTAATVYAPTTAGYSTLAALPAVNQTNLSVLQKYGAVAPAVTPGSPVITIGSTSVPTGIIPIAALNYSNKYYGVASVDYVFSDKDQLRGRYIYDREDTINTTANLPVFYTLTPARYQLATLAEYHTFGPHLTNELRLAYQRQNQSQPVGDQTFPGLDAFPNLQFVDLNLQVGPNPNYPQATIDNLYQGVENLTWIHGSHTLKFGTEFRDYIAPEFFVQRVRGDYDYTKVANYLQDFTPDSLGQRNLGVHPFYGNQLATYSYGQDTWRIRPNLTLDLGARYEYSTVPLGIQAQRLNQIASVPGLIDFHAPKASPYGIAPRVGFAWTPSNSGNTVIRSGFGIAYDVTFDNVGLNAVPPEFSTTVNVPALGVGTNFLRNGGITQAQGLTSFTVAGARAATSSWLPDQRLPYSINYTLDVQHIFAKNYTLDVRYLGTKGVHLITQQQLDRRSPVTATVNIPTFMSPPSSATLAALPYTVGDIRAIGNAVPAYASAGFSSAITAYTYQGYSDYNSLAVQLNRRFNNGLQFQAAYTWSHLIDNSTAEVASTYLTPRRAQDFFNLSAEKASSALDHRQRVTISAVYDAPWFKASNNWFVKNLIGNWEIAPIYTYESPEYYTVQSGGIDSNLNADSAPDRTIVNPSGIAGTGSAVYGLTRTGAVVQPTAPAASVNSVVAWVAANPNGRYIQAGLGAVANAGRNTEPSRPIDNIDITLLKRFTFHERFGMEFSAEALNLFNHPQFIPGRIDNVENINTFTSGALSYVSVNSPTFNNPTQAFSSNPRVIQVVAKFTW